MEPATVVPVRRELNKAFGSLIAAALFGALIAITLLYMWGADIAEERGATLLKPSTDMELQ